MNRTFLAPFEDTTIHRHRHSLYLVIKCKETACLLVACKVTDMGGLSDRSNECDNGFRPLM
jgi:hypothetical protein